MEPKRNVRVVQPRSARLVKNKVVKPVKRAEVSQIQSVTIGDTLTITLLQSASMRGIMPALTTYFEQLQQSLNKAKDCKPCQRKKRRIGIDLNAVRQILTRMNPAQAAVAKDILKAKQLKIKTRKNGQYTTI